MQFTIKQLRQAGFKVRVIHQREFDSIYKISGEYKNLRARGGRTTIQITTPDKQQTVTGVSLCSELDNFNHKIGNQIALGRALQQLKNVDLSSLLK